jgi:hypothetical protein
MGFQVLTHTTKTSKSRNIFAAQPAYQNTKFLLFLGEITPYAQIPPKSH